MNRFKFEAVWAEFDTILSGVGLTIMLSVAAIILGSILAVLLVAARSLLGRWAGYIVDAYVELMRNTPFLVQLFMIFFGLPLIGLRMSGEWAALLAMTMNLGAYASEIIRAGVDSIHRSQLEAGLSLALTRLQVFTHVILKPAFARVWPALSSQFVLMMLASSICSFISVSRIVRGRRPLSSRTDIPLVSRSYIIVTHHYIWCNGIGAEGLIPARAW